MNPKEIFRTNLETVQERIKNACDRWNRNLQEVVLMAVTKTHPPECADWAIEAGLRHIGENRVQEGMEKRPLAVAVGGIWELIGPLQSNKVRMALENFDRIQTVDRLKIIHRLDRTCEELGKESYPVLLQVNIGDDPAKHGCCESEASVLVEGLKQCAHLKLEGLMTIGEFSTKETVARKTFSGLRELRDRLSREWDLPLETLSMGMTGDLEWAIAEGSTLVRVGTALFGSRE